MDINIRKRSQQQTYVQHQIITSENVHFRSNVTYLKFTITEDRLNGIAIPQAIRMCGYDKDVYKRQDEILRSNEYYKCMETPISQGRQSDEENVGFTSQ